VLVLRIVKSWDGCGCSLGGERWDGKEEEGEIEEDWWVYNGFSDGITDGRNPSVIPLAIPSVKVSCHCTLISV
jgi:hypothetical protein